MEEFIAKHRSGVSGVLSGWDRVLFRGSYRMLCVVSGMMGYLWQTSVLLKDFGAHAEAMTRRLMEASLAAAERAGRPVLYLASSQTRKEDVVQGVLREQPVEAGLICVIKCVEPCMSYDIHRNRAAKKLELQAQRRKCLHLYHYFLDPVFGLMHARIQTWFPFTVQVCLNGREWLARRMDAVGLAYERDDNCFPWIADFPRAQKLMDRLLRTNWPEFLDGVARRINPAAAEMFGDFETSYYWSAHQTEWATDVAFNTPADLAAIYPQLVWGAMTAFQSPDVLRFLGRTYNSRFAGEVTSDFKDRAEGIRVKHAANGNSVKIYDKGPNLLRIETTINYARDLKVYRTAEGDPQGQPQWRPMRKGIADLQRRAQLSQNTNERYLDALAQLDSSMRLEDILAPVSRPRKRNGHSVRALRPWTAQDQDLLQAIQRPEFLLAGFRNRDLAALLYPDQHHAPEAKRRAAAKVSYRLGILRAHGLIAKLSNTRCYRITVKGQRVATAAIVSQKLTIGQLTKAAA
ncbi:MAG: hypothetical protein NTW87_04755 [Planctomycetota bacterium]|nr:hypothetical protein [Planctomycetota bacterium]